MIFSHENLHVGCGFSHMFHWKKPPGKGWNPRFDPKRQDRESLGIIQNLANALVEEGLFSVVDGMAGIDFDREKNGEDLWKIYLGVKGTLFEVAKNGNGSRETDDEPG